MMNDGYLHQQARLTTGTIAHNDKLSTDFRHIDRGGMFERMYEKEGSREELGREILVGEGGSCEGEWLLKMGNLSVVGVVREHTRRRGWSVVAGRSVGTWAPQARRNIEWGDAED